MIVWMWEYVIVNFFSLLCVWHSFCSQYFIIKKCHNEWIYACVHILEHEPSEQIFRSGITGYIINWWVVLLDITKFFSRRHESLPEILESTCFPTDHLQCRFVKLLNFCQYMEEKWHFSVVFICIIAIMEEVEHLFYKFKSHFIYPSHEQSVIVLIILKIVFLMYFL